MARDDIRDVIILGAGIAGLAAAEALRDRNILVLEAADRAGGRILSAPRGKIWLNFGAHMFGGPESPVGRLAQLCGLELRPIGGRLMGMVHENRRLLNLRPELYPVKMRLSLLGRLDMIRMGLRLRLGSGASAALQNKVAKLDPAPRRARLAAFEDTRTLSAAVGRLSAPLKRLLTAITERTGADPEEMSAGHGFRSFANVWSSHSPGNNLAGGSARLPQALAARLGDRLRLQTCVTAVTKGADGLYVVHATSAGQALRFVTRQVLFAVPAPVARELGGQVLPAAVCAALGKIRYGAFLTAALHLDPQSPRPWAGHYAISTPGRAFSVLFDMGTTHSADEAAEGASLMLFRGARGAAELMAQPDAAIEAAFRRDLDAVFPETKGHIRELVIRRWPEGAPFSFPGRADLDADLLGDLPPGLALAGDYLDFPNMDAAIHSGETAAARLRAAA